MDEKRAENIKLCKRCSSFNLDIISLNETKGDTWLADLGPTDSWSIGSCSFCTFLADLVDGSQKLFQNDKNFTLGIRNNSHTMDEIRDIFSIMCIKQDSETEENFMLQDSGMGPFRRLKPIDIDFSLLQAWLKRCQHTHAECNVKRRSLVAQMLVIDCHSRRLVPAAGLPYVALSYVWGSDHDQAIFSELLPKILPSTIEDSITVTMRLGYRYLWIDRYCINQQDAAHASSQINQMDLIYSNAIVAIMAAAGGDPSYGLPGISIRRRSFQLSARLKHFDVLCVPGDLEDLIQQSPWSKRGWTYQESILPARQLIFTEEQVCFLCCESQYIEVFKPALPNYHGSMSIADLKSTPSTIHEHISIYTRRALSHQFDRLNAFLGVLRAVQPSGVCHCWGLPLLTVFGPEKYAAEMEKTPGNDSAIIGLCWTLASWESESIERLPSFPSWSWVGWAGPIHYCVLYSENIPYANQQSIPRAKVCFELSDNSIVTAENYCEEYAKNAEVACQGHFIHISARRFTFKSRFKANGPGLWAACTASVQMDDGQFIKVHFGEGAIFQGSSIAIEVGGLILANSDFCPFVMLIHEIDGRIERIGGHLMIAEAIVLPPNAQDDDDARDKPFSIEMSGISGDKLRSVLIDRYGHRWWVHIESIWETVRIS